MNIYKISQNINNDYDTYDSAIVVAENEDEARNINPDGEDKLDDKDTLFSNWVTIDKIDKIKVELIGVANSNIKKGVLLASFNAG